VFRRRHDVREEDGHGEDIAFGPAVGTGQELFDLVHHSVSITHEEHVVFAGQHHELGMRDVLSQVAASAKVDQAVSLTVQDQSRNRDGGEKRAHVHFEHCPCHIGHLIGATEESHRSEVPGSKALVGDPAGSDDL
jgi:hypothetical protein